MKLVHQPTDPKCVVADEKNTFTALLVTQLAERSLTTPEDPGSNPTISIFTTQHLFTLN